ncbi:Origin recognition complex subunit 2 [Gnomoniopsis smithogilvyi]|uniref:Origin recognition complex subunit 2 n=1 Tax=Gnomoniopsis smithogilvyi TaxID=1191159 RepID=A0A9W8YSD3_9PEZI|nr:Origin recognition complex subunit 2 [Gnomoniopsis smithogilvyi]
MPPKKAARKPAPQETRSSRPQRKREVVNGERNEDAAESTPSKRRRTVRDTIASRPSGNEPDDGDEDAEVDEDELANAGADTPSRRHAPKSSATPASVDGANGTALTPNGLHSVSKLKFSTPSKQNGSAGIDTPGRRTIADRSARRKSARALIDRVVGGATSDDEAGDENLARAIYESSGEEVDEVGEVAEEEDEEDAADDEDTITAATPSKTKRGRKKGNIRKRSPTPPRDLPSHEKYFFQNKPGLPKTSTNTLATLDLLTHDEYFSTLRELKNPHEADIKFLENLHAESFKQWSFELAEGFGLCLYGYGSKRALLHRFAKHLYSKIVDRDTHKIVVINGYVRATNIREILTMIVSAVDSSAKLTAGQPATLVPDILSLLSAADLTLTLVVHSADAPPLRKSQFHTILSQLAAHDRVRLVCSVDTPDFTALWDSGQRSNFNFAFHDATTFASRSTAELEVVDEVHELLGRRARRVGGKDGVAFVLKSLPENAKNLFRLLVGEILVAMEDDSGAATGGENPGVEYRMLYNKAVEEFICSSEMAFRTLLKEFHDHQMITSRKDILGTELLSLPFRREELEAILEDLVL